MDLVLLHGWGFGSHVWQAVAARLAGRCRVHCADLPGYGTDVLAANDLPAGAAVCAWSLGAFQALRWAAERPDRVARLVLVGATPRFVQAPDWPAAQPPDVLAGFAAGLDDDPAKTLRRFAALANQGDEEARTATRALTAQLDSRIPAIPALAAGLAELRDTDLRALVPTVRQPALVIHGERDPLMPLAAGRWLAAHLPAGRLEIVSGAAHAPFLSQPERFTALLAEFLREP